MVIVIPFRGELYTRDRLGIAVEIHPNPTTGFGPILFAEWLEGPDRPTILSYGYLRTADKEHIKNKIRTG